MTRWPDAYIIGAPKCATTSLYHYLGGHPGISCPLAKENHFLMHGLWSRPDPWWTAAQVQRAMADVPDEKRVVDVGVMPLYHEACIEHLQALRPDARIIILVRDPVDLLESLHSQAIKEGRDVPGDLESALERMAKARTDRPGLVPAREAAHLKAPVTRWQRAFDDVLVLHFEDLQADVQGTYDRITDFIGVDRHDLGDAPVHNPDARIRSGPLHRFLSRPPTWVAAPWRRLPRGLRDRIGGRLEKWNRRPHERPDMDAALRRRLQHEYADDIAFVAGFRGKA